MQVALDQVAQHCLKELDAYSTCVEKHPHRWQSVCATLKADLKDCAAANSGMVNDVKARCAAEIEQYDRCLKANVNHPDTCMPQLHRLWQCSEEKEKAACSCEPPCSSKPGV
ncbi:coiled-coil-helix-coiled-coil-helix domain-containing protein 5 [Chrysochromulina tobinii]|uniref:Coiled-coil-helix-coiled-coil-helix domain-containing protein 5 n=1 Tax=Chrysochromulina tobinii TaxID=1460289 RepID=A0A0M0J2U1_9EUKA|nr:coiled-coil-helix-coiled-coil-helix domain-containing protein 5 [Chrysochromulina tobinii]|eukprot:KOO20861.1 coiled-coil-helix-coiled-coil-helix domain-containing protein 5 [Chrysochromulina sp. CCMP291]